MKIGKVIGEIHRISQFTHVEIVATIAIAVGTSIWLSIIREKWAVHAENAIFKDPRMKKMAQLDFFIFTS